MTITFGKPIHLQTPFDGIEFSFPFIITNNEIEKHEKIKVEVSRSLAANLGFEIWQDQQYYAELIRILYPTIKIFLIEEVENNIVWCFDKINLNDNNCDIEKLLSKQIMETIEGNTFPIHPIQK